MDDIKVSVIVPIYNVEEYLEECLISLEKQTLKDIEIRERNAYVIRTGTKYNK